MKNCHKGTVKLKVPLLAKDQIQPLKTSPGLKMTISPIVLKNDSQSDSGGHERQKVSIEGLCFVFLDMVASKKSQIFQLQEFIGEDGVKPRRIYDLMNILEGCGFVSHLTKGNYRWKGFDCHEMTQKSGKSKKKDTTLKNLASKVKSCFLQLEHPIEFKDLCNIITQQMTNIPSNPSSIQRRIYECCKVLKIFGLVSKQEQKYKWIKDSFQRQKNAEIFKTNQTTKKKHKKTPTTNQHRMQEQSPLISQILETIHFEQDLQEFISNLRNCFLQRRQRRLVSRQLKFQ